ncbi:MAG: aspartate-semialdehyde dehydrogenase [Planctomycetota bacterium]
MKQGYAIAVAGATGAVGVEILNVLESRGFPVASLRLLASEKSIGKMMKFKGENIRVEKLAAESFRGVEIAFFSAGASRSLEFCPAAVKAGAAVVDNSSAFRMDPGTPLVIPEVNPEAAKAHKGIIANPNCCTIIMAVPVWPLHKAFGLRRMVASTYQAASGAGAKAMEELEQQTREVLAGRPAVPKVFAYPIAFNLFSHNTAIGSDGYNGEETKVMQEMRKIFNVPDLRITVTCVRVPVLRAHSEALNLEFARPVTEAEARRVLETAPGVTVVDDRARNHFPMPIEASGQGDVLVGRIRRDVSRDDGKGLDVFVAGDQLLKGAALNAVQIAEILFGKRG